MDFIPGIEAASGGLQSQRARLDVIAQNIANAQTTRGPNGQPYARQVVSFESELIKHIGDNAASPALRGVRVSTVAADTRPGPVVHNPSHPDADAQGFVRMPNVNMAMEMVDLISATRAYEANLAVVKAGRDMATKTLDIGR
ncbi:MAG: flagellar basal body rod protein FlgC [Opitutaceae bacterium]